MTVLFRHIKRTDGHRQNSGYHQDKGFKGYTFTPHHQRDSSRLSE